MKLQDTILGTHGPMARSARDLELFNRVVIGAKPWEIDQSTVKMWWRRDEVVWKGDGGKSPRVGVMWDDGVVRPQPPMRRALKVAVDKLKAAGLELVDYAPFKSAEAWELAVTVSTGTRSEAEGVMVTRARCTFPMEERGFDKQLQTAENHYCP